MNAVPASTPFSRLLVGFASESGNARALAQRLGADLQPHGPQVLPFNDIDVARLGLEYQRDQLQLEVLLDIRDLLAPAEESKTSSLMEKAQKLRRITKLR